MYSVILAKLNKKYLNLGDTDTINKILAKLLRYKKYRKMIKIVKNNTCIKQPGSSDNVLNDNIIKLHKHMIEHKESYIANIKAEPNIIITPELISRYYRKRCIVGVRFMFTVIDDAEQSITDEYIHDSFIIDYFPDNLVHSQQLVKLSPNFKIAINKWIES